MQQRIMFGSEFIFEQFIHGLKQILDLQPVIKSQPFNNSGINIGRARKLEITIN